MTVLAEKEHLKTALEQGKVFKSALTADESKNKKTKGLQSFKSLNITRNKKFTFNFFS